MGGGDPDRAVAQRDLGASAFPGVAAAAQCVQGLRRRVEDQRHYGLEPQLADEAVQGAVEDSVRFRPGRDPRREPRRARQADAGRHRGAGGLRRLRRVHRAAAGHAIDLRASQPHHLGKAMLAADRRQLRVHAIKHIAVGQRADVHDVQDMLRPGPAADHHDRGEARRLHVRCRLRKELVRERDVLLIHHVHLRQVGDVGDAIGVQRGDRCRDHAFEAVLQIAELDGHASARARTRPAPSPGVWSKTVEGRTRSSARGSGSIHWSIWDGRMPRRPSSAAISAR